MSDPESQTMAAALESQTQIGQAALESQTQSGVHIEDETIRAMSDQESQTAAAALESQTQIGQAALESQTQCGVRNIEDETMGHLRARNSVVDVSSDSADGDKGLCMWDFMCALYILHIYN